MLEYEIPNDKYLLLGDNRPDSRDSREFGLFDKSDILGKAIFRFYPFNKIGLIDEQNKIDKG